MYIGIPPVAPPLQKGGQDLIKALVFITVTDFAVVENRFHAHAHEDARARVMLDFPLLAKSTAKPNNILLRYFNHQLHTRKSFELLFRAYSCG